MNVIKTKIADLLIIEPKVFGDERGFFYETYQEARYKAAGITADFVQDNRSRSTQNVLRGLHFQKTKPQGKLVTVTQGRVFDVAVDLRPDSPTFGQHESVLLTGEKRFSFTFRLDLPMVSAYWSETADFQYKCTDYYDPTDESGLLWNDPALGIEWPLTAPLLSPKDSVQPTLAQIRDNLVNGW